MQLKGIFFAATELHPPDPLMEKIASCSHSFTRMEAVGKKSKKLSKLSILQMCVCVCVYVRVCVHKHARMHTWVCTWVCLCAVAWVHVLAWAHVLVCALAHISVCVCVCVCMRVCVCWPVRLCILSLFWKHHQCSSLRHVSFNFCFLKHILSNPAMMSPHSDVWTIPSESQHPTQVHTRAHTHTHTHTHKMHNFKKIFLSYS